MNPVPIKKPLDVIKHIHSGFQYEFGTVTNETLRHRIVIAIPQTTYAAHDAMRILASHVPYFLYVYLFLSPLKPLKYFVNLFRVLCYCTLTNHIR